MKKIASLFGLCLLVLALNVVPCASSSAALRLTITDSTVGGSQVFTSATNALVANTTIGGYSLVLETVATNFPGDIFNDLGSLSQTLIISSTGAPLGTLTLFAEVIQNVGDLTIAPLASFSYPLGPNFEATTQLNANSAGSGGLVSGTTTVNGATSGIYNLPIGVLAEGQASGFAGGGPGYTLRNQMVISGFSNNVSTATFGLTSQVVSSAQAEVPEPATMTIWAVGAVGMAFSALRRRKMIA